MEIQNGIFGESAYYNMSLTLLCYTFLASILKGGVFSCAVTSYRSWAATASFRGGFHSKNANYVQWEFSINICWQPTNHFTLTQ